MKLLSLTILFFFALAVLKPVEIEAAGGRVGQLYVQTLYPVAAVTGDTLSSAIDLAAYEGQIMVVVNVAAAGSGNTIDLNMKEASTSGGSYTDVASGSFTQIGNTASQQTLVLNKNALKRYVKLNIDITTGTSISADVAASILGFKKVRP